VGALALEALGFCASSFFSCAQKLPPTKKNNPMAHSAFTFSDIAHPAVAQVARYGQAIRILTSPVYLSHPIDT